MVVTGGDGGGSGSQGGPLRLLGYLKANKNVAYVLAIMVLVHLSNQYDRRVIVIIEFILSVIPPVDSSRQRFGCALTYHTYVTTCCPTQQMRQS